MTYKSIILTILLVPCSIRSDDITDARIQQLEEKLFQKELELSRLGATIAEKDNFFSSLESEVQRIFSSLLEKKVNQTEKKSGKSLSQEEEKKLSAELSNETITFACTFCANYRNQENIHSFLLNGLIREEENADMEFESLKFYIIRCTFERELLKHFIVRYEKCLHELRDIQNEIIKLDIKKECFILHI